MLEAEDFAWVLYLFTMYILKAVLLMTYLEMPLSKLLKICIYTAKCILIYKKLLYTQEEKSRC